MTNLIPRQDIANITDLKYELSKILNFLIKNFQSTHNYIVAFEKFYFQP